MALSSTLSDEAIALFKQQWDERLARAHHLRIEQLDCPLHWLMPELLRLAQEFGDSATLHEMRPLVRRMVNDLDTVNQPSLHGDNEIVFECYIDTLVAVLAQVRDRARTRGQWLSTGTEAAPIMCG